MSALTDLFTTMANKIRSKTGTVTTYTPAQMASTGIDDVYAAGAMSETLIWTNPSPTTSGSGWTISYPDDVYKYIKILYKVSTGNAKQNSVTIDTSVFPGTNDVIPCMAYTSTVTDIYVRTVKNKQISGSTNDIQIGNIYATQTTSPGTNFLIPIEAYGIK